MEVVTNNRKQLDSSPLLSALKKEKKKNGSSKKSGSATSTENRRHAFSPSVLERPYEEAEVTWGFFVTFVPPDFYPVCVAFSSINTRVP